ncbi:hotdog domain-containing protein [Streptomyces sp. WMMC1477]|uniref:hotdog domain-containing protein n=1 Tax=Streptomyces sp. WMMC1477 TaxID=3015155 RepID=UPI0022B70B27|nr:hotdog domain-containing protein [Streptomyces sp. WMMC1477]MCZ7432132.1 MaoC/PaaZ C-terminal domain-containing protein [Streptomyces sp. WMMC1477]
MSRPRAGQGADGSAAHSAAASGARPAAEPGTQATDAPGATVARSGTGPGLTVGQVLRDRRVITDEDIAAFADLAGDRGQHHVAAQGRAMAHGLLTASLATKIGGQLDFIARRMGWEFLRPVWSGDTITAEVTVTALREGRSGTRVEFGIEIHNQDGETVLRGDSSGVIRH